MKTSRIVAVGLAIFTMLFGAGNVVFPLGLGRETGSQVLFAVMGLILTGVVVPLLGLVSTSLFDGDYKKFLGMAGKIPGAIITLICMLLVGPFGATPRCIALAHAAVRWYVPYLSPFVFSLLIAVGIFFATYRKNFIVELFGRFLGPLKLTLLFSIVIVGLLSSAQPEPSTFTALGSFFKGIQEGYLTLDLIGTIFFSGLIISSIKAYNGTNRTLTSNEVVVVGLKAGLIGGGLLGIIYTGFCLLAAKYGPQVVDIGQDQLLSALATLVLGPKASVLASMAMAMACLTTAIALTAVFAEYLSHELFFGRMQYHYALLLTVTSSFIMTNLGFSGIAHVIEPVAAFCYPTLIVLSLANIAYKMWGFRYVQVVTLTTFFGTLLVKFLI